GIGLARARRAAAAGGRVTLIARDRSRLAAAREAIRTAYPAAPDVATFSADVSLESELLRALAEAGRLHGPIDLLVASAGISSPGYFEELPVAAFERAMAVNYFGTLYALKAIVPEMRRRGRGAVVLISSGAGLCGFFGYTAYAPGKFALRGLAESLRAELRGTGVHVSIVYPPDTDTPQLAEENQSKPPETKAITARGGLWTADEVARVTLEGVAHRCFAITPGWQVTALSWTHSILAPVLRWSFDRTARKARPARQDLV
ncbi:MAG: SDR family oxidoreductase, partial [Opitutus sp.]